MGVKAVLRIAWSKQKNIFLRRVLFSLVPYVDKMVAVSEEWIAISILRLVEMVIFHCSEAVVPNHCSGNDKCSVSIKVLPKIFEIHNTLSLKTEVWL